MNIYEVLVEEFHKIEAAALWGDDEKAAARSVLRGIAARTGVYREFTLTVDAPDNVISLDCVRHKMTPMIDTQAEPMALGNGHRFTGD